MILNSDARECSGSETNKRTWSAFIINLSPICIPGYAGYLRIATASSLIQVPMQKVEDREGLPAGCPFLVQMGGR